MWFSILISIGFLFLGCTESSSKSLSSKNPTFSNLFDSSEIKNNLEGKAICDPCDKETTQGKVSGIVEDIQRSTFDIMAETWKLKYKNPKEYRKRSLKQFGLIKNKEDREFFLAIKAFDEKYDKNDEYFLDLLNAHFFLKIPVKELKYQFFTSLEFDPLKASPLVQAESCNSKFYIDQMFRAAIGSKQKAAENFQTKSREELTDFLDSVSWKQDDDVCYDIIDAAAEIDSNF